MQSIRYFSLFSGVGGFELGIQQAFEKKKALHKDLERRTPCLQILERGITKAAGRRTYTSNGKFVPGATASCIGFCEIDRYATQIYRKHFPGHRAYGDITTVDAREIPDFDLLVGGFPCQSFSIAGRRGGFKDARGALFFEITRIVREKQPRFLLLENVKGLLSHAEGRTFLAVITALDELGYDLQWQVLNSKNHGVPQNRERVFIVGHLGGTPRPQIFPFGESGEVSNEQDEQGYETAYCLQAGGDKHRGSYIKHMSNPVRSNECDYGVAGLCPTLNTMQGGGQQPFISDFSNIRKLTPTECERLQGFPDGWTKGLSDTQRYKCLGNAVTVNVIEAIVSCLFSV